MTNFSDKTDSYYSQIDKILFILNKDIIQYNRSSRQKEKILHTQGFEGELLSCLNLLLNNFYSKNFDVFSKDFYSGRVNELFLDLKRIFMLQSRLQVLDPIMYIYFYC
jgi:hypothetical protein